MNDLTQGSVGKGLLRFALPYLFANFLQLFYGMVDLYVIGRYNEASATTAVSIGSQVMHMLTVVIAGFAMGITVHVGRAVGAKEEKKIGSIARSGFSFFVMIAVALTIVALFFTEGIVALMQTPTEAVSEAIIYLRICFIGIPFIVFFNYIASLYRGFGDSKSPLYFVGVACLVNVVLDFVLVGGAALGVMGAAIATVCGQAASVLSGVIFLLVNGKKVAYSSDSGENRTSDEKSLNLLSAVAFWRKSDGQHHSYIGEILSVGAPIALQDGLIQVSFLLITVIANQRGLIDATAVGIVEKLIGFFFLVPSAFLSALSTATAQNMGANQKKRAEQALCFGISFCVMYGLVIGIIMQFIPGVFVGIFTSETAVIAAGCTYIRSYIWDTTFAGVHFCFSGYFCGNHQSVVSFIHNIVSIVLVRIPGAYFASLYYPDTLYPMGWAAPLGSVLSSLICVGVFLYSRNKKHNADIV